MNREVKFKVYDIQDKKWLTELSNAECIAISGSGTSKRFALLQFSGIKDSDGKEVFEGDILKGLTSKEIYKIKTVTEMITIVEFYEGKFSQIYAKYLPKGYRTVPPIQKCHVVGNIFDNPELL